MNKAKNEGISNPDRFIPKLPVQVWTSVIYGETTFILRLW
jgi:hypothetical protein